MFQLFLKFSYFFPVLFLFTDNGHVYAGIVILHRFVPNFGEFFLFAQKPFVLFIFRQIRLKLLLINFGRNAFPFGVEAFASEGCVRFRTGHIVDGAQNKFSVLRVRNQIVNPFITAGLPVYPQRIGKHVGIGNDQQFSVFNRRRQKRQHFLFKSGAVKRIAQRGGIRFSFQQNGREEAFPLFGKLFRNGLSVMKPYGFGIDTPALFRRGK